MNLYQIYKDATNWEKEMFLVAKKIEQSEPYDLYRLNKCLEDVAKKYIANNELSEGETFVIPMKTGDDLVFAFYKNATELVQKNTDSSTHPLIYKDDNGEREKQALITLSDAYKKGKLGIGERFPEQLRELLHNLKQGDVITCQEHMYICDIVFDHGVSLKEIPISIQNHTIASFQEAPSIQILYNNDIDIQSFYDHNKSLYTSRMEAKISSLTSAQEWINKVIGDLPNNSTKEIHLGELDVLVQRHNKQLHWYNKYGEQIDESIIKKLYVWFQTAPVERKIISKHYVENYDDILFFKELENDYAQGKYTSAIRKIEEQCNKKGYIYQERSYIPDGDGYIPRAFGFVSNEKGFQIFELFYQDNDFTGSIQRYQRVSEDVFIEFCAEKYNAAYMMLTHRNEDTIRKDYPHVKNHPVQNNIINKTANTMAKMQLEENPFISEEEFAVMKEDVYTLLDFYDDKER